MKARSVFQDPLHEEPLDPSRLAVVSMLPSTVGLAFGCTASRTGKLVMGILALIAEFENDIRRERQMDGIKKAHERGVRFGRKPDLTPKRIAEIRALRADGSTVPEIIRRVGLSKATVYRALGNSIPSNLLAD